MQPTSSALALGENATTAGPALPSVGEDASGGPEPAAVADEEPMDQITARIESNLTVTEDLWSRAFKMLETEDPELTAEYTSFLKQKYAGEETQDDASPALQTSTVRSVLDTLVEEREQKKWRFSVLGSEIVVREQVEKMLKFVMWTDDVVKPAISSEPHASLAWSGVTLVLPVS